MNLQKCLICLEFRLQIFLWNIVILSFLCYNESKKIYWFFNFATNKTFRSPIASPVLQKFLKGCFEQSNNKKAWTFPQLKKYWPPSKPCQAWIFPSMTAVTATWFKASAGTRAFANLFTDPISAPSAVYNPTACFLQKQRQTNREKFISVRLDWSKWALRS